MKILVIFFISIFAASSVQGADLNEPTNNGTDNSSSAKFSGIEPDQLHIDDKQKDIVEKFQIQNSNLLTDDYLRSDNLAIELLAKNKWDVAAATKSLKRIILWRTSNHIQKLGETEEDPKMAILFPYTVIPNTTRNGCPVLHLEAGKWYVADYMESHDFVRDATQQFSRHSTQMQEKLLLANLNSTCGQAVWLFNVARFTTKHYAEPNAISVILRFAIDLDNYYPSLFKKIFFVNSNPHFGALLKIITPSFGETGKKIVVFNDNEKEQAKVFLDKYISPEKLPPQVATDLGSP